MNIRLDNDNSCVEELQLCSRGLAQLTQEATRNLEALAEIEDQYERVEALVAKSIRNGDSKLTATEVKARFTELVTDDPDFSRIREGLYALRAEKESLERRLRTLEKRASGAQSALNRHLAEVRYAGHGGTQ